MAMLQTWVKKRRQVDLADGLAITGSRPADAGGLRKCGSSIFLQVGVEARTPEGTSGIKARFNGRSVSFT